MHQPPVLRALPERPSASHFAGDMAASAQARSSQQHQQVLARMNARAAVAHTEVAGVQCMLDVAAPICAWTVHGALLTSAWQQQQQLLQQVQLRGQQ